MIKKALILVILFILILTQSIPLVAAQNDGSEWILNDTFEPSASIDAYWTAERMARAKPLSMTAGERSKINDIAGADIQDESSGELKIYIGSDGESPFSTEEYKMGGLIDTLVYPPLYTRKVVRWRAYKKTPWKRNGKLFFVQNGKNRVCSAAVIQKNAIITAGKCLHDGKGSPTTGWSTTIMFVPAFRKGNAPFGKWYCETNKLAHSSWVSGGNVEYDIGACRPTPKAQSIGDMLGWYGLMVNGRKMRVNSFGWPTGRKFLKGLQYTCISDPLRPYDAQPGGYKMNGMGCDMTGGYRGGPWIYKFKQVGGNLVYGINSYKKKVNGKLRTHITYSPYFSDTYMDPFMTIVSGW